MADVVIAGAGPVGLLLGCLLAGGGAQVLLCEARTGSDERTRAIGIHPPGLAALRAAGIEDAVRAEAVTLARGEVHARGRMLASVPFGAARPVLTLPQHRTDALLRGRLHELGGELRTGGPVSGIRRTANGVVAVTADGGEHPASFLIAADGVRSALRAAEEVGWTRRGHPAHYAMIDISDDGGPLVACIHCEPTGLVESFPLPGGRRRWVIRRTDREPVTARSFTETVLARTGTAIRIPDGDAPVSFTASQHRADRIVRGRVVLLGDAAHETSPIGGQGMNLGWSDAVLLAPRLLDALARGDDDLGDLHRRVTRRAARAQRRSAFYMAMGAPASPPVQVAREALIRSLGARPARGAAARLVTMGGL